MKTVPPVIMGAAVLVATSALFFSPTHTYAASKASIKAASTTPSSITVSTSSVLFSSPVTSTTPVFLARLIPLISETAPAGLYDSTQPSREQDIDTIAFALALALAGFMLAEPALFSLLLSSLFGARRRKEQVGTSQLQA